MVACGKKRKTQNLFFDTDYTDATDFKTQNLYLDTDYTVGCLRQEKKNPKPLFRHGLHGLRCLLPSARNRLRL
jgi:hypothetical protein